MLDLTARPIPHPSSDAADPGRVLGISLRNLRHGAGLTQAQIAARLGVNQAAISKIERRGDVHISSLVKYIEALGGRLRVDALFDGASHNGTSTKGGSRSHGATEEQLVLPLFHDSLSSRRRDIILAIHPTYSKKIIDGEKTVELRRRFATNAGSGSTAYIYSTAPVQALIGYAHIVDIHKLSTEDLWMKYRSMAQIDKNAFDTYFAGRSHGFALEFGKPTSFSRPIELAELRTRFSFSPPQSFSYVQPALLAAIHHDYARLSN
jgi:predicted transcriptional regulator/DNA-binding XRE family transcriptional regulator